MRIRTNSATEVAGAGHPDQNSDARQSRFKRVFPRWSTERIFETVSTKDPPEFSTSALNPFVLDLSHPEWIATEFTSKFLDRYLARVDEFIRFSDDQRSRVRRAVRPCL